MPPGYWYFIALAIVVLPLIPFSAAAALIAGVWVAGQGAYYGAGIESAWFDFGCNAVAAIGSGYIALKDERQRVSMLVLGASFIVMAAVNLGQIVSVISAVDAWWSILFLALTQVVIVPANTDWRSLREGIAAIRDLSWVDRLMRVVAWRS